MKKNKIITISLLSLLLAISTLQIKAVESTSNIKAVPSSITSDGEPWANVSKEISKAAQEAKKHVESIAKKIAVPKEVELAKIAVEKIKQLTETATKKAAGKPAELTKLETAMQNVKGKLNAMVETILNPKTNASNIANEIKNVAEEVSKSLKNIVANQPEAASKLTNIIEDIKDIVKSITQAHAKNDKTVTKKVKQSAELKIKGAIAKVGTVFQIMKSTILEKAKGIISEISAGIKRAVQAFNEATNKTVEAAAKVKPLPSSSKHFTLKDLPYEEQRKVINEKNKLKNRLNYQTPNMRYTGPYHGGPGFLGSLTRVPYNK